MPSENIERLIVDVYTTRDRTERFLVDQNDSNIAVSVCCLAYNHAGYIRDAMEGFLSQVTDFDYEIVVHDDASTDGTIEILKEYEDRFPDKVRVIYEEENQYTKAGRLSIDIMTPYAKGKYIAFCEGDDFWIDRLKLQRQFDYMETHPGCSMCFHNAIVYDCRKGTLFRSSPEVEDGDRSVQDIILKGGGYANCTGSFFYRRSALDQPLKFFIEAPVGDYPLMFLLALRGKVRWMAEPMMVYRCGRPGSWTADEHRNSRTKRMSSLEKVLENLTLFNIETDRAYEEEVAARKKPLIDALEYDAMKCKAEKGEIDAKSILDCGDLSKSARIKLAAVRLLPSCLNRRLESLYYWIEKKKPLSSSEQAENEHCARVLEAKWGGAL